MATPSLIPQVSGAVDPSVRVPLQMLVDVVNRLVQNSVTQTDLVSAGIATLSGGTLASSPPSTSTITPEQPANLTATGAFASIILSWRAPVYTGHAYTMVFRSATDNVGTAEFIGSTVADVYADKPPNSSSAQTYYYWIKFVSTTNTESAYNQTAGTPGTTSMDPTYALQIMTTHPWAASTSFVEWQYIQPTGLTSFRMRCTTPGTTGSTEPTWGTPTVGQTFNDGTVVWTAEDVNTAPPLAVDPVSGSTYMDIAYIQDATITDAKIANLAADKIQAGTITAAVGLTAATITGGTINIGSNFSVDSFGNMVATDGSFAGSCTVGGSVSEGQTAFNTGNGFWLGNDAGTAKFSTGDSSSNYITWDGTTLNVAGNLAPVYSAGSLKYQGTDSTFTWTVDVASGNGTVQWSAWLKSREFSVPGHGTITMHYKGTVTVNGTATVGAGGKFRVYVNGVAVGPIHSVIPTNNVALAFNLSDNVSVAIGDTVSVYYQLGAYNSTTDLSMTYCWVETNKYLRATELA